MVDKRRELNSRLLQIESVPALRPSAASTAVAALLPDMNLFPAATAEQICSPPVVKAKGYHVLFYMGSAGRPAATFLIKKRQILQERVNFWI
ncbi:unnamed protein product [Gongylonema pulchrum]|uniref:Uncharacterized protein n=1 Tax=Gongylonema pulchrum TaxID=637853 RepID=A0A183DE64_9BILA|nr:unnamed protein product [Gongylonema pulchrum]